MPGIQCSYGDVTRVDVPIPFFLRESAFLDFDNENYSWEADEDITVLVKCSKRPAPKTSPRDDLDASEASNIGGCPLECPFDPNENFEGTNKPIGPPPVFHGLDFSMVQYEAMDLPTCRGLVKKIYEGDEITVHSLCLDQVSGKLAYTTPIYVACDGSPNAKDLVMIGFHDEKFLELRMMGPYKRQSTQLNLDLFLAYHQHLPNVNPVSVTRQVHAVYEKLHGEHVSQGKVFMEFLWNDPKSLFEPPPTDSASAKLAIQPRPGDANPYLQKLWEEIAGLEKLLDMWDSTKASEADKTNLSCSILGSESEVALEMHNLLSLQAGPAWRKGCAEYSDSMDDALQKVATVDRHDVDFVDRVWNILRNTASWDDLIECFHVMFKAVEGKMYRPYLLPSNQSLLSELLKGVMTNQITNYRAKLSPSLVVEVALDCGLHKLYKDYAFILGTCHLIEPRDAKAFLPQRRLYKESLQCIKKLHCIMEVLCLSRERLSLAMTEQEIQTRKLLEYFAKNPLNWDKTFHFDIPMNTISPILTGLHPVYWNLKLESSTALRVARTNAVLARDFFIGHAKKFYVTADGTMPRGYYLYVHRVAQRKM
ncbi:protein zwilch homolog isoform X1 [Folsomia candida]|uniref:protein zwilch homolog isoform X1 n=1 Tax=Folsomia candida TaxID=158441 RepID=UPI000B8F4AA7|nr:protein zwilch homolog isoform X1 [Folsomia candida]